METNRCKVLSLDLDWFNYLGHNIYDDIELEDAVIDFFIQLRLRCQIPNQVTLMKEHHYLYPWSSKFLARHRNHKIDMINVDEHHDFYNGCYLRNFAKDTVDCANFFIFMAHERMLSSYTWITNCEGASRVLTSRGELDRCIRDVDSPEVRAFRRKVSVRGRNRIWDVLEGQRFDGFVIIQSEDYTNHLEVVCEAANYALKKYYASHNIEVFVNKRRSNFSRVRCEKLALVKYDKLPVAV